MEDSVYLGSSGELRLRHITASSFDAVLEVDTKRLNQTGWRRYVCVRVCLSDLWVNGIVYIIILLVPYTIVFHFACHSLGPLSDQSDHSICYNYIMVM